MATGENAHEFDPPPGRILVSEVNWLGDLVMSLPALRAVRRTFPHGRIAVLVREDLAGFFDHVNFVDEVIVRRNFHGVRDFFHRVRTAAQIRGRRFQLAILFPNSFDSALIAAMARVPARAGFVRDGRGPLLTHKAHSSPELESKHQVHYWLEMLRQSLGIEGDASECTLEIAEARPANVEALIAKRRSGAKLIALAPGAAYGPAKEWPEAYYSALIDLLDERHGADCVLVGSPSERAKCERIAAAAAHGAIVAAGDTGIAELAALLASCDGFAGNDSGSMHLAAASGIPTAGIFGSTDPRRTGPLGTKVATLYHALECSPCLARTCRFGHYNCLRGISPDEVVGALEGLGVFN